MDIQNKTLKSFLFPKYSTNFICLLGHLSRNYFIIVENMTNQVLPSKVVVGKPKGISNPRDISKEFNYEVIYYSILIL